MAEKLSEMIDSSDLIIIGIGSEWNWVKNGIENDEKYSELLKFADNEDYKWLLPIIEYEYAYYHSDQKIEDAYRALRKLIGDKKYFLISDTFLQDALMYGFEPENTVFPCGTYMYLQTTDPGDELILSESSQDLKGIVARLHDIVTEQSGVIPEGTKFAKPILDGKEIYLNQKRSEYSNIKYNESAYQEGWSVFMNYLSHTLNNNLLILELGVGLEYPTVIRWPFEKVAFLNKKAHFVRVHERLYQHTPEIEDKTDSIQMNSVDYILQES